MQAIAKNVPFVSLFFNCRRYILDWRKFVLFFYDKLLVPRSYFFLFWCQTLLFLQHTLFVSWKSVAFVWRFIDSFLLGMLHGVRTWMILKSACVNVIVIVHAVCELCRFVEGVSPLLSDCPACVLWTRILFVHSTNWHSFVHCYCDHDCADDPSLVNLNKVKNGIIFWPLHHPEHFF